MKNFYKRIMLGATLLLLPSGLQAFSQSASASESQITFTLHKLLFENGELPDKLPNDGTNKPSMLQEAQGLNDVTFALYDVSEEFYDLRASGKSIEEGQQQLAQTADSGKLIEEKVTATQNGEDGIAVFTAAAKEVQGRDAVYRFVETNAPSNVDKKSDPLVVVLPVYSTDNQVLTNIHLYPKNEQVAYESPPLEKEIVGNHTNFEYGDSIPFNVSTKIPASIASFDSYTIKDTADSQLWLDAKSLKVTLDGKVTDVFQVKTTEHGFRLTSSPKILANYSNQKVVISYQMTLKGNSDELSFDNTVELNLGKNSSMNGSAQISAQTGGKQFIKVDRKQGTTLANAHFVIRNEAGKYLAQTTGENHWVDKKTEDVTVLTSDKEGLFAIKGLAFGEYELIEIKAPDGYIINKGPVSFMVEKNSFDLENPLPLEIVNEQENTGKTPDSSDGSGVTTKPVTPGKTDKPGITKYFPKTSEEVVRIFSIIGFLLVLLAGAVWIYKKKQQKKDI
ncbi:SpaH/EbpB family LPXTG-anchored major pilin [Enterococcus sp. JM9B]|uniref:SpaH/EbpB family LPXTG-anchored major pilin n=1 Tax=Enterococcus sp. JM9B TaxID=1857216 RepID=UPI001374E9A3|nr:SpaH/EbpB family LPXTG-anchored major pilin [Enterococcus sp. JM9B]